MALRTRWLLRVALGLFFAAHGLPKLLQPAATVSFFHRLGVPWPGVTMWLVAAVEVVGGLLLAAGVAPRYVSLLLMLDTLGVIVFATARVGFAKGWGYEAILLVALLAVLGETFRRPHGPRFAPAHSPRRRRTY
ncbi:MAG: DoxX family protein [Thermaerobacter sp.]|nr:DoxX family protein [Thermaerobacter sp.]